MLFNGSFNNCYGKLCARQLGGANHRKELLSLLDTMRDLQSNARQSLVDASKWALHCQSVMSGYPVRLPPVSGEMSLPKHVVTEGFLALALVRSIHLALICMSLDLQCQDLHFRSTEWYPIVRGSPLTVIMALVEDVEKPIPCFKFSEFERPGLCSLAGDVIIVTGSFARGSWEVPIIARRYFHF